MKIWIVKNQIKLEGLKKSALSKYGNLVKAVVDIEKEIMAIEGELHADEEALLLSQGSKQKNLWGINLYPEAKDKGFVEFDSIINLRPMTNNFSRGVDDPALRKRIINIVNKLIEK